MTMAYQWKVMGVSMLSVVLLVAYTSYHSIIRSPNSLEASVRSTAPIFPVEERNRTQSHSQRQQQYQESSRTPLLQRKQVNGTNVIYTTKDMNDWIREIRKLHLRFKPQTLPTCNNTCILLDQICKTKSFTGWETLRKSASLTSVPLLPKGVYVFPWDNFYLSFKPLTDLKKLPDLNFSKIYYTQQVVGVIKDDAIAKNNSNIVRAVKNQEVLFRVDLVDSYGEHRRYGGDEVRAWISDSKSNRAMTGIVQDLGNGSYSISITPKYPGLFKLYVTVSYPREALRAGLHQRRDGRYRFMLGRYQNGTVNEITLCQNTPNIPGRPCVCNHTDFNKRPYYCGKPLDSRLQCHHWDGYKGTGGPITKSLTPAELQMELDVSRPASKSLIKQDLSLQVDDDGLPEWPLPKCLGLDPSVTWNTKSPRGAWVDGVWNSFICKEPRWKTSWVKSCLVSSHVWMIGDSNMKQMYNAVRDTGNAFCPTFQDWKLDVTGHNIDNNSSLTFRGHEHPRFHYNGYMPLLKNGGIEDFLARIPSHGKHFVVIHYFLHYAISDLSAMFVNLVATRDAVSSLLKRNPSVIVGIRGPHTASIGWRSNHLFGGDVLGTFVLSMMDVVFKELRHQVILLDGWDMTISAKNTGYHPSRTVPEAMMRTLFAFKCPGSYT